MTVRRTYATPEIAARLVRALEADRPSFVRAVVNGSEVAFTLTGPTARSVRATADDLLACLAAAENATGIGRSAERRAPSSGSDAETSADR